MAAPVCPWIEWTDVLGSAVLRCLGYTFDNWTPDVNDVGDSEVPVGNSRTYFFAYRQDQIASFEISQIANTQLDLALRLKSQLVTGGLIIIHTEDSESRVYNAYVAPGTTPTLELSDTTELEYTLKMVVVNNALPVPMLYTPFPSPRVLDDPEVDVPVPSVLSASVFFTDSYIGLPDGSVWGSVPGDWTVEGWIHVADYVGYRTIIGFGTTGDEFLFAAHKTVLGGPFAVKIYQSASGGVVFASNSSVVPIDVWTHVAISRRASDGKMSSYINGSPDRTLASPLLSQTSALVSAQRRLLGDHTGEELQGYASDLRIWNIVRTPAEIAANYNRRLTGSESGLAGYWRLDEGPTPGTTAPDSSPGGNNGTFEDDSSGHHAEFSAIVPGPTFLP